MKYNFNVINDNLVQIIGDVTGWMVRNQNGDENLNHYDFEYKFFKGKELIKVSGVCKNLQHLKQKIDKEF